MHLNEEYIFSATESVTLQCYLINLATDTMTTSVFSCKEGLRVGWEYIS